MSVVFRGRPACDCQAEWLPVFEQVAQLLGILDGPLPLSQIIGGAVESGGTHATGGADDTFPLTTIKDVAGYVRLSRDMGADATWLRPEDWDGDDGVAHVHRVLRNCPHNGPARYQITAVDANGNGLGAGGMGGRDDGPRPLSGRTWREGIEWANQLLAEADDVAWTDELAKWQPGDKDKNDTATAGQQLGQARGYAQAAYLAAQRSERAVKALAKALGPEVEAAVAKALADAVVDVDVTINGGTK